MITEIQVDGLALELKAEGRLSTVVKDQPVVAVYKNSIDGKFNCLGQVLGRNNCSDILRLSIGVNQQTSELFITLTIWIRTRRSRNKCTTKGRLMFLVVPTESLALETSCDDYDVLVKQIPGIISERPSDDKSGKCKLLKLQFDLGSTRSYVIMPQYRRQANVTEQQMALLRKLRSLSESTRFQLVANYDEATFAAIQDVCKIQSRKAVTPSVVLEKLYSSKQSGCIDEWVRQGWCAQDSTNKNISIAGKDVETQNESENALGPPPYKSRAPSSSWNRELSLLQQSLASAGNQSSHTSPQLLSTAPPYTPCPESNVHIHESTNQHASAATPDSRGTPGPVTSTCPDHSGIFCTSPLGDPSTPVSASSSNYIATFLSEFSGYSNSEPVMLVGHDKPTSSTNRFVPGRDCTLVRTTRESTFARVEVPATDPANAAPTFDSTSRDMTSRILDSATRKRRLSQSPSNEMARPATRPFPTSSYTMHYNMLSSTVADSLSCRDVRTESGHATADRDPYYVSQKASPLSSWLLKAWEHCPVAHHVLPVELLRLATAINHSTCDEDIATNRVACTLALIDHCTGDGSTNCSHAGLGSECNILTDLPTLTLWLYRIHPKADMEFFPSLIKLSLLVKQSQNNFCQSNDYQDPLHDYKQQKADIVGQACLRYSDELLQQDSEAIMSRMLVEK